MGLREGVACRYACLCVMLVVARGACCSEGYRCGVCFDQLLRELDESADVFDERHSVRKAVGLAIGVSCCCEELRLDLRRRGLESRSVTARQARKYSGASE